MAALIAGDRPQIVETGLPGPGDAARCPGCAWRSYSRSAEHRGLPAWPARYTVIAIATGEDLGTFESAAEVAGCLAFSKLAAADVEIVSDTSEMARHAAWS